MCRKICNRWIRETPHGKAKSKRGEISVLSKGALYRILLIMESFPHFLSRAFALKNSKTLPRKYATSLSMHKAPLHTAVV